MSIHDRGFASMSKEKRRAIASMGGKAIHQLGRAHQWTKETAKIAGSKGGRTTQDRRAAKAVAW